MLFHQLFHCSSTIDLFVKTNMVSTRKKRQLDRSLLNQLHGFDKDVNIGNVLSNRRENTTVNEGTADQEFAVGNSNVGPAVNENMVNGEP